MIFGFGLPTRGPLAQPDAIKTVLEKAEKLGLGYVSVADHVVILIDELGKTFFISGNNTSFEYLSNS